MGSVGGMPRRAGSEMSMTAIRTVLKALWLVLALAALPAAAATSRIYITNSAGDAINVIDPETNTVVQTIKGEEAAHGINFSPDGTRVYVSNEATSTLDVFDQKTGDLIQEGDAQQSSQQHHGGQGRPRLRRHRARAGGAGRHRSG